MLRFLYAAISQSEVWWQEAACNTDAPFHNQVYPTDLSDLLHSFLQPVHVRYSFSLAATVSHDQTQPEPTPTLMSHTCRTILDITCFSAITKL